MTADAALSRALYGYETRPCAATEADLSFALAVRRDAAWLLTAAVLLTDADRLAKEERNAINRRRYAETRGGRQNHREPTRLCSVGRCVRPVETGVTCWEHAVRFERVPTQRWSA